MKKVMKYRPDIDGLRALAVVAVIFFHFDHGWFPGGFTGVDVFFVISGYLIINIILTEMKAGEFSLLAFWERRIRRIIPAMFVVMLVTAFVAYFILLLPSDLADFGRSMMAQSVFLSNWWFMGESDYFAAPAETMPLLHLWTLAVEEQFYLLFPLLAVALYPYLKSSFKVFMVALTILSFAYGVMLVDVAPSERFTVSLLPHLWGSATNASAGFYFIFSRLWEFMVGGLIAAYALSIHNKTLAELVSWVGIGAILASFFLFSETTAFPGKAALLPVLGAAAIIVANSTERTTVGRLLSHRTAVWIGLLSYSLYLWHWPVISLLDYYQYGSQSSSTLFMYFLLGIIVLLSYGTYRYVETPIRQKQFLASRRSVYGAGFASMLLVFGIGYAMLSGDGFPERLSPKAQAIAVSIEDTNPRHDECFGRSQITASASPEPCLLGVQDPKNISFVLWGDSHANAAMPAFDTYGEMTGKTGVFFGAGSCPPFITEQPLTDDQKCIDEVLRATTYIQGEVPEEVFLLAEWREGYKFPDVEKGHFLSALLYNTIYQLPSETQITVFRRLPTYQNMSFRDLFFMTEREGSELEQVAPRHLYEAAHKVFDDEIDKGVNGFENVRTLNPFETMCDTENCYMGTTGRLYFHDSSHLSTFGAQEIILPLLLER